MPDRGSEGAELSFDDEHLEHVLTELASEVERRREAIEESEPAPRVSQDNLQRFQPGQVISGRYRIERLLAKGGMGRVFLATQLPLGRPVAVKVLIRERTDREFRQRFLLEASTCARLVHRNIVTVHDYGETEAHDLYMAMEYLDGVPLSKTITQLVRLPGPRACRIAIQVCRALRAAHAKGVVHRDLKPSNIMLLRDEEAELEHEDYVKVLDFGLVKIFEDSHPDAPIARELTRSGTLLGSPKYMAPEQIKSEPLGPRTDVYSLGVILFHMLAGRPPFIGQTSVEILEQHLKAPVPSISKLVGPNVEIAPELEVIVRRAMEKSPADRHASMDDLLCDLKAAHRLIGGTAIHTTGAASLAGLLGSSSTPDLDSAASAPALAPPPPPAAPKPAPVVAAVAPPQPEPARRPPSFVLIAAALAAAIVLGALASWTFSRKGEAPRDAAAPALLPPIKKAHD